MTAARPLRASVQFADPTAPSGAQVSAAEFRSACLRSALSRFGMDAADRPTCRTVEHPVPPKPGDQGSTGLIVAHVSPSVCKAWESEPPGGLQERRQRVDEQIHLALEDLADQDMHGYLALTKEQCAIYDPDLVQLVNEALDRTTFNHLDRAAAPRWEGTLVERVEPPFLVLVVSIDFARKAAARRPSKPAK